MGAISEGLRTWLLGTLHLLPGLVLGFVVHEACHALAAVKLGDPTPAREGRLTLDPTAHVDLMGLITYLLLGWGYARPVRITVGNIRHGKWGEALVALAGPLSNLVLGAAFYALWRFAPQGLWSGFLLSGCCSNFTLCVLNLVPVAPLDAFSLLKLLLPLKAMKFIFWMQRYGIYVLLVLSILNILDLYLSVAQTTLFVLLGALMG